MEPRREVRQTNSPKPIQDTRSKGSIAEFMRLLFFSGCSDGLSAFRDALQGRGKLKSGPNDN
jgi:hypothetical protein